MGGAVLKVVPMVLILVLTISLVEAFLILPNHLSHSLQKQRARGKHERPPLAFKARFLKRFEAFRNNQLVTAVDAVVRWRYLFLG